jgi:hypothetical protein
MLVGAAVVLSLFTVASAAPNNVGPSSRRWAIVKFSDPVLVQRNLLMGQYLVVHDDARMARGEPCTSIHRFDPARGPQAVEVEFMCKPEQRAVCDKTTLTVRRNASGFNELIEYQFAGDSEVHGIPTQ